MASSNRAVVFQNVKDMRVESLDFPKLEMPNGRSAPHGVILKIVATNICGSDLHIYRGSFPVPQGMVMGHEMTGTPSGESTGVGDVARRREAEQRLGATPHRGDGGLAGPRPRDAAGGE